MPSKRSATLFTEISDGYRRCNIVADRYFQESLKNNLRSSRGIGPSMTFTKLPSDFRDFLANSENKSILNEFLAKIFIEDVGNQTLVVTYKDNVLSNNNTLVMDEDIAICLTEEADQRLIRQAYYCFRGDIFSVVIST